jgi:hypothetical protein
VGYEDVKFWHQAYERDVASDKKQIAHYTKQLRKDEKESAELARALLEAGLEIAKLQQ